jgi:DNA-binding transcriptional regulator YdaS (Cro superfamily)
VTKVIETVKLALAGTGSSAALARELAVTPSHVSRLKSGKTGVSPEISLRLSRIIARPALQGLRDDGHADLADVLQALIDLRDDKQAIAQRKLDEDLAALPPTDFRHVRALIASLANAARRNANARR